MCGCTLSLLLRLSYCGELSLSLPYSNVIRSALNLLFLNELAFDTMSYAQCDATLEWSLVKGVKYGCVPLLTSKDLSVI